MPEPVTPPPNGSQNQKKTTSFTIGQSLRLRMKRLADQRGETLSEFIERSIECRVEKLEAEDAVRQQSENLRKTLSALTELIKLLTASNTKNLINPDDSNHEMIDAQD